MSRNLWWLLSLCGALWLLPSGAEAAQALSRTEGPALSVVAQRAPAFSLVGRQGGTRRLAPQLPGPMLPPLHGAHPFDEIPKDALRGMGLGLTIAGIALMAGGTLMIISNAIWDSTLTGPIPPGSIPGGVAMVSLGVGSLIVGIIANQRYSALYGAAPARRLHARRRARWGLRWGVAQR